MTREVIRIDEVAVTVEDGVAGASAVEAPLVFDVEGERVVVMWDARSLGGPVIAFGLAPSTAYAVAMVLLRRRRDVLRGSQPVAARAQAAPSC